MGRSKYRSNEAHGPILGVESRAQTTFLGSGYKYKVAKCYNPQFCPLKQKNGGSVHFQWEYAWLSVWHIISQQRCETEQWFKRTTYRKLHIRSPMVTWLITSCDPKRSRLWPQNLWRSISQQPCEIHGRLSRCILTTNRKPHLGNPMVIWPMTSRDRKDQTRDPNTFKALYLKNRAR